MLLLTPAVNRDASRSMWKPAPRAMRCIIFVAVNPSCCCAEFEFEPCSLQNYKTRSDVDDATPSNKRKRSAGPFASSSVSKKQVEDMTRRMADSVIFSDDSEDEADDTGPSELTLRDVCQQEFDRFRDHFTDVRSTDYPLGALLSFWAGEGRSLYPNMERVARVLLSVPASSLVLERDFSTAGRLITGSRSRLTGGYVQMTLFLNGNQEYIPVEVPTLPTQQAQEAFPHRLTNPRAEVVALPTGMEDVIPDVVDDANIGDDEYVQEADFSELWRRSQSIGGMHLRIEGMLLIW